MTGYSGGYRWADVYEQRWRELQKDNNDLAQRLGAAQARQDELTAKLAHIEGNRLWKAASPFRRAAAFISDKDGRRDDRLSAVRAGLCRKKEGGISAGPENDFQKAYITEAYRQKNPYLIWIERNETKAVSDTEEIRSKFAVVNTGKCGVSDSPLTEDLLRGSEYVLFVPENGVLAEGALGRIDSTMSADGSVMLYADEDYYWHDLDHRLGPWFKPDWSPDTLLSFMYFGNIAVIRTAELAGLKWYGSDSGVMNVYSLYLQEGMRVLTGSAEGGRISHISSVLFHMELNAGDSFDEASAALDSMLKSGGLRTGAEEGYNEMKKQAAGRYGIRADFRSFAEPDISSAVYDISDDGSMPSVSIIILSKDHPDILRQCIDSVRRKTDYPEYEIIVVDNGSSDGNRAAVTDMQKEYDFRYIYEKREFNFSAMCNIGVKASSGRLIFLMNDDVEVIEKDWMRLMAGQAMQPHAGAVGAKLYYADTVRMQHIGITNLEAGPAHKLTTYPDDHDYYYGRNSLVYDMIGVTGAALMIRREIYDEVGGLCEDFPVAYNDVDFCMSVCEKGYYNVQRNDVVLYHHESLSRGSDEKSDAKLLRLMEDMDRLYSRHPALKGKDPFYNINLTGHISDYLCDVSPAYDDSRRPNALIEKIDAGKYAKSNRSDLLKLTVDHVRHRGAPCLNEDVILIADGWAYLPGEDNSRFDKWILLMGKNGVIYRAKPDKWYRQDVIDILPGEKNVDLAGFIVRVAEKDLPEDDYRIGMLCLDTVSDRKITAWTDSILKVPHETE